MRAPGPWPLWRIVVGVAAVTAWALNMGRGLMPELVQALPLKSIAVAVTIFAIGFLIADLTNPTSWLRRWMRWRRRIADVESIVPASNIIDGYNYLLPAVKLSFVRDAPKASLILDIQSCAMPGRGAQLPTSIVYERERSFVRGEKYRFVLATVPVEGPSPFPPAHYGPKDWPSPPPFVADSVNVLTIILRSGWRTQRYRIHLRSPMKNSHAFGRLILLGEDYDAFGTVEGPAFH